MTTLSSVVSKAMDGLQVTLHGLDKCILNNTLVANASLSVLKSQLGMIVALKEVTHHTVRVFYKEGKGLSRKSGSRTTWYTSPLTALESAEYLGTETGRLVYVDLEINILSEYSPRFYKLGDEAYTLKGDLMKVAKRKWKYASELEVSKTVTYIAHLQAAAGMALD